MASNIVSDEFLDLQIWDNTDFEVSTHLNHPFPALSTKDASNSWSSFCGALVESPNQSPLRVSSISTSHNGGSPRDTEHGSLLPSPPEDEIVVDRDAADKEERRRKQNRLAQRAFRERREGQLKQLEKKIADLENEQRRWERKYKNLRTAHLRLRSGLRILLEAGGTFNDMDEEESNLDLKVSKST